MSLSRAIKLGFVAGLLAAAAILAIGALARLALPVLTPPEVALDLTAGKVPGPLFSAVLDALEFAAKPLFLVALALLQVLVGAILGSIYAALFGISQTLRASSRRRPWLLGAAYGMAFWVVVIALGAFGLPTATWAVILAALMGFALLQAYLLARFDPYAAQPEPPVAVDLVRRDVLVKGVVALVALSIGGVLVKALLSAAREGAQIARTSATTLSAYITPNDEFYRVSKNVVDPTVDARSWRLEVEGLVERPFTLTLDELKSLPSVTRTISLECISNEVGGDLMGNAVWKGVPLRDLLDKAGVSPQAIDVVLHAADTYADSITVEKAMDPANLIAYEMNGEPLPDGHGFPARLLVPGIYGMKNVKWLTGIEPVARDYTGFWQGQGWSDAAVVRTTSRIDAPGGWDVVAGQVAVGGIAFAGDRGISRVEVSFDGGTTWQQARLEATESPLTWALWVLDWKLAGEGPHTIIVRATDGQGTPQEAREESSFPDGASGYHKITVTVRP